MSQIVITEWTLSLLIFSYQNCDDSFCHPHSHIVTSAHYISSFSIKFDIIRNRRFVIYSELKYFDVDVGDDEDVAAVQDDHVDPYWVPDW